MPNIKAAAIENNDLLGKVGGSHTAFCGQNESIN